MFRFHVFTVLLLSTGIAVAVGCAQSSPDDNPLQKETSIASAETASNANCPIMGKPVTDEGGLVEWNGESIGFCCPKCIDKWEALSEEDKASHIADANHVDHDGH